LTTVFFDDSVIFANNLLFKTVKCIANQHFAYWFAY